MGQPLVIQSDQASCDHQAVGINATRPSARVTVGGQAIILTPVLYSVVGCPFTTESPKPCAQIQFATGATRVMAEGVPVLLGNATGMAIGPLPVQGQGRIRATQVRVQAE